MTIEQIEMISSKTIRKALGFSLVEMLVVVAVIGIIAAIAIPSVSNVFDTASNAKDRQNARQIDSMSAALAALGVAHVIPESMGGVQATARLFREGIIVSEGPMAGERFVMASLSDDDIEGVDTFLQIRYDTRELSLEYDEQGELALAH